MNQKTAKGGRLNLRISVDLKQQIEEAAKKTGKDMTKFILEAVTKAIEELKGVIL